MNRHKDIFIYSNYIMDPSYFSEFYYSLLLGTKCLKKYHDIEDGLNDMFSLLFEDPNANISLELTYQYKDCLSELYKERYVFKTPYLYRVTDSFEHVIHPFDHIYFRDLKLVQKYCKLSGLFQSGELHKPEQNKFNNRTQKAVDAKPTKTQKKTKTPEELSLSELLKSTAETVKGLTQKTEISEPLIEKVKMTNDEDEDNDDNKSSDDNIDDHMRRKLDREKDLVELAKKQPIEKTSKNTDRQEVLLSDDDYNNDAESVTSEQIRALEADMDELLSIKMKAEKEINEGKKIIEEQRDNISNYECILRYDKNQNKRLKEKEEQEKRQFIADAEIYRRIRDGINKTADIPDIKRRKTEDDDIPELFEAKYYVFKFFDIEGVLDAINHDMSHDDYVEAKKLFEALYQTRFPDDDDYMPPVEYHDLVKRFLDSLPTDKDICTQEEVHMALNEQSLNPQIRKIFDNKIVEMDEYDDDENDTKEHNKTYTNI